ncbi:MAG: LysR family transcriptional regulator [Pseudomonadota bacterium]
MDKFASLQAFVETIDEKGFSAAARKMGVATSSVTRLVDSLEHHIGTTLINRSTRHINLTAAGEVFYSQAKIILRDLGHAEDMIRDLDTKVKGRIKITAPVAFGRLHLMSIINQFMVAYPAVQIDLNFSDDYVDLIEHDLDMAIRIGPLPKTGTLIVTKILPQTRHLVGTPKYFEQHGMPQTPNELQNHTTLIYDYKTGQDIWRFAKPDHREDVIEVVLEGRFRTNNSEALLSAVKSDIGIALLPNWLVNEAITQQTLVTVLNDYLVNPHKMQPAIYLCYPENRRPMKKISAFVAFLKSVFLPH